MTIQFNPYLTLPGNCAEAMQFYAQVLGGTPQVMSFRDSGMDVDGVMHANLTTPDGVHIFASDHVPGMGPALIVGTNVQLSMSGDETETMTRYFNELSEGGEVVMPLAPQSWGDTYGLLTDRYGVLWHVNIAGS